MPAGSLFQLASTLYKNAKEIYYILLTMIVRGSKSVLLHGPSGWKNHEVGCGNSRFISGARQHSKNGRIL